MQFLYMLKGWVDLEFGDRGVVRLKEGESMMIPGGLVHQEITASEIMELLEVSVPAKNGNRQLRRARESQETGVTHSP